MLAVKKLESPEDSIEALMLLLHARLIVRNLDRKALQAVIFDRENSYSIKAYYLGQNNPSLVNPFEKIDHPYQKTMIDAFNLGSAQAIH